MVRLARVHEPKRRKGREGKLMFGTERWEKRMRMTTKGGAVGVIVPGGGEEVFLAHIRELQGLEILLPSWNR